MSNQPQRLLWRCFVVYLLALLCGTSFIVFNNIVYHHLTIADMLQFHIPFVLASDILIATVLVLLTRWRLRMLLEYVRSPQHHLEQAEKEQLFKRMLRYPYELFGGVIVLAVVFIFLFHTVEVATRNEGVSGSSLAISIGSELMLACIVAVLLFLAVRAMLRSHLLGLVLTDFHHFKPRSLAREQYLVFFACFIIAVIATARLIMTSQLEETFTPVRLIVAAGVYTAFSVFIFALFVHSWKKDIRLVAENMLRLSTDSKAQIGRPLRIFSGNETGSLMLAFNRVQQQLASMVDELAEQMKLARELQQRLLPTALPVVGRLELASYFEPCHEVGGDFYEVVQLDESRLAVAIGDVSGKGMSAAVLMSAMMAGLRDELSVDGTPGEILTRLNERICAITKGVLYVTVGLAIIECADMSASVSYASAGHLSPYRIGKETVKELAVAALPMGIVEDEVYSEQHFNMEAGETFLLYTDGVIEAVDKNEKLFGFEQLEETLNRLEQQSCGVWTMANLLEQLPVPAGSDRRDDRTLVMIRL